MPDKNSYFTDRQFLILGILIACILLFIGYIGSGEPEKIKKKLQSECYEKVFGDDAFWIFKAMKNENKTFIYCNNEWGTCVCKFYWGTGVVIYKDKFYSWEMPNLKEVQKEGYGTERP